MARFWTSDQHFDHRNINAYSGRPFRDVDEMREELIRRHNAVIGPDDDVWHLGDFSLDKRTVPKILPLLNGRHHLVMGNHDACHPCHRRSAAMQRRYLEFGFVDVVERIVEQMPWGETLMCHMPPAEGADPRYPEWRPDPATMPGVVLHGHVHERYGHRRVGEKLCVNVGVDQRGFAPVSEGELASLIVELQKEKSLDPAKDPGP